MKQVSRSVVVRLALCLGITFLAGPGYADEARVASLSALFDADAFVTAPSATGCTLSGGTKSTCIRITLKQAPTGVATGPWCPTHVSDDASKGGIWLDGGAVHDVDGAFLKNLPSFYDDDFWQVIDPQTGAVNVTDSKESCQAAARPDVDPQYYNHCVECQTSYLEEGAGMTYTIPLRPVIVKKPGARVSRAGVGVTFSGVRLDGPAPVNAILSAHTIAPFDDCGGHVNLHVGYHIHAVTDCLKEVPAAEADHAPLIGIAMDGIPIHARLNAQGTEPDDLDRCRGHETGSLGYHYHVAEPGANAILGCHMAETGCASDDANTYCDATKARRRPPPGDASIGGFIKRLFGVE